MAEKKVVNVIKLQIPAGAANPAPPVGPALGAAGVNIMQFCQAFNAETQDKKGDIIPVEISVYEDKSFSFITKTPPAAHLIKKETGRTPQEYIQNKIIDMAKEQLAGTTKTVNEISYMLGFQYSQHFSRYFKRGTGMTPAEYRKSL